MWIVLSALLTAASLAGAVQTPRLAVHPDQDAGHEAIVSAAGVLAEPALEEALESGLPLRLRFRVELWRQGFFDALAASREWEIVLMHEPLEGRFHVIGPANPAPPSGYGRFRDARAAVETSYRSGLAPTRPGTYYYTASVVVETLSLSDLDELRRWLRGELGPAVSGDGQLPGAIGRGLQRLVVRILRLPDRHYDARSQRFTVR